MTQLLVVCERDSFIYIFCFDVVHILVLVIHVMFASYCSLVLSRHHHYHYYCQSNHAQDHILSISPTGESLHAHQNLKKDRLITICLKLFLSYCMDFIQLSKVSRTSREMPTGGR